MYSLPDNHPTKEKSSLSPLVLLKKLKPKYEKEGFGLFCIFGSHARGDADAFSDVDIAYKIDHDKFHKDDAFRKLIRIEEIASEIESVVKRKVDMISFNSDNEELNKSIQKEMVLL